MHNSKKYKNTIYCNRSLDIKKPQPMTFKWHKESTTVKGGIRNTRWNVTLSDT